MIFENPNGNHRRRKAAIFFIFCGIIGSIPHWIDPSKNLLPAFSLALVLGGYGLRVVLRDRDRLSDSSEIEEKSDENYFPNIDVLVSARDEENVVEGLIQRLSKINYPTDRISFWIIDDGSQDNTNILIKSLIEKKENFNLLQRPRSAGGGKSGALNFALSKLNGDWVFILDADAQFNSDILVRVIRQAKRKNWSALQLRKAVVNNNQNILTVFQSMEMAMDAVIQRGRLRGGGVVELRGNGQLIKRKVLEECGGFNEETVTDDLDLSFRLLFSRASVGILWDPPIHEEAVSNFLDLFKQRQRWAEGGLQRFFDYYEKFISSTIRINLKTDLICFFILQYVIPLVSFWDLLISLLTKSIPLYWPLSFIALAVSGLAYWKGCSRVSEGPEVPNPSPIRIFLALLYLLHWFVVIPYVALKMALFTKRLVWVKTIHKGHENSQSINQD